MQQPGMEGGMQQPGMQGGYAQNAGYGGYQQQQDDDDGDNGFIKYAGLFVFGIATGYVGGHVQKTYFDNSGPPAKSRPLDRL